MKSQVDAGRLRDSLADCPLVQALEVVEEIDSTNLELLRRLDEREMESVEGTLLVACHQTRGRGRRERHWHSAEGGNLLCSLAMRPSLPRESWGWLAQIAGLAVADAIVGLTGLDARIKWPNDVFIKGGKVAGVLVESRVSAERGAAVIGVGINVGSHPELDDSDAVIATSLKEHWEDPVELETLCVRYVNSLERCIDLASGDPDQLRKALGARSMILGQRVVAECDGREIKGVAESIGSGGSLILRTDEGAVPISVVERLRLI